jgi:hypothetical protein
MTDSTYHNVDILLQVDWGGSPLWVKADDDIDDAYLPEEINDVVPLSDDLVAAIDRWDLRFQELLNKNDPANSRDFTPEEDAEFIAEGRRLASRIKSEVPAHFTVQYIDVHGKEWPVTDND